MDENQHIADLCRRLAALLDNPEPGVFSWLLARGELAKELYEALGEKVAPDPPTLTPADAATTDA